MMTRAGKDAKEQPAQTASGSGYGGDVFLYYGNITKQGYHETSEFLERKEAKKRQICMVLITYGGDPHAAYRIARAINHHYKIVEILIPDVCKSAGTLLCIGARKLIIGDRGELGPLDVQISRPDELFESMSGLDIMQALNTLEEQILRSFSRYLVGIRSSSRMRTKIAADIAAKLALGFISPIVSKLDPATLGENWRAIHVGLEYGRRLDEMTGSLRAGALDTLVSGFPSHRFVIDRKEATTLFKNAEAPDSSMTNIYRAARRLVTEVPYPQSPIMRDLSESIEMLEKENEDTRTNGAIKSHSSNPV